MVEDEELDDEALQVYGWDRDRGILDVKTVARRPKARQVKQAALQLEQWRSLADRVDGAPEGSRRAPPGDISQPGMLPKKKKADGA